MDRTLTVPFVRDESIRFRTPIASCDAPPIRISQSLNGALLFVEFEGRKYAVSVEKIAVALVETLQESASSPAEQE